VSGLLLDTNVLSELRKRDRANPHVRAWSKTVDETAVWLSVLVLGEIRCGIEAVRPRDAEAARHLDRWLGRIERAYEGRVLVVDRFVSLEWGRLNAAHGPLPSIDGLLAATALVHDLTLVTRNTKDVARTGTRMLNPFKAMRTGGTE
jgi:predicted nucleic acid-binding protein